MKIEKSTFLERRHVIKALGAAALAGMRPGSQTRALAQCALLGSPSLTEGPYFVDEDLNRSDVRGVDPSDGSLQAGYPVSLTVRVAQLRDCATVPLTGAYVDIWHCNALGIFCLFGCFS